MTFKLPFQTPSTVILPVCNVYVCAYLHSFIQYTAFSTVLTDEILKKKNMTLKKWWWLLFCHGSLPQSLICSRCPGLRPKFVILVVFKSSHHKVFSYTSASFQAFYSVYPSKWFLPWTYMAVFWVLFCSALVRSSLHLFPVSCQCCLIVPLHTKTFERRLRLMNGHSTQCDTAAQFALSLYLAAPPCLCESAATRPLPRRRIDKTPGTMHFCTHSEDDRPG